MNPPVLWFLCPDTDVPAGGVRVLYRVVDHLNAAGVSAFVVHQEPGFRCTWFDHATPVASADRIDLAPGRDLLVVPELYGPRLADMAPGVAKVVFNQNVFNTFHGHGLPEPAFAYEHPEVLGAVVVSDDNAAYLRYAFPRLDVRRITLGIDPRLFHPGGDKEPVITYMPRKSPADVLQVLNLLAARRALDGFTLLPLDGLREDEVAAAQRRASVFLSFAGPEGFGLPPAEAMACGAIAVGYHGWGGRELLGEDVGFPVAQGDVVAFAQAAERVLDGLRDDPAPLRALAARAAATVAARHAPAAERASVLDVFDGYLSRAGLRCATLAA